MKPIRLTLVLVAAAAVSACAQSRAYDTSATRGAASPLGFGPTLNASDLDVKSPTMSISDVAQDSAARRTGEIGEISDTLWQFPEPVQSSEGVAISARSTFSLL